MHRSHQHGRKIRAKIARDGGLVIPEEFRRALGIEAGGEILLRMEDGELCVTTQRRRIGGDQLKLKKTKQARSR